MGDWFAASAASGTLLLAVPVAVYVLAIAVMGFGAATIGGLVLLGAAMFMASDAILGAEKFLLPDEHGLLRATASAVWILYFAGQAEEKVSNETMVERIVEAVEDKAARMRAEREAAQAAQTAAE